MQRYSWKVGSRFAVAAEVAGPELESIREQNGGTLTPPVVVEASRPDDAPLHPCFTWDDEKAAGLYRLVEARQVLNSLHVTRSDEDDARPEIAYVHVTQEEEGPSYMTAAQVLSDDDLRDLALQEALTALRGFQRRFAHLEELAEVFKAMETVKPKRRKKQRA